MPTSIPSQKPLLTVQNCHRLIPHVPDVLVLPIVTYWDGTPCANTRLHGVVTLGAEDEGLCLCYHPLPGPKPDFHQPERFPSVRLEGRA